MLKLKSQHLVRRLIINFFIVVSFKWFVFFYLQIKNIFCKRPRFFNVMRFAKKFGIGLNGKF